ncbi:TetR/AcrR family transcriptional regulator [Aerococcaceae bacterium WGS1372]
MPHETFFNLPSDKRQKIENILLETFYHQPLSQVKVSDIVTKMKISRGAFYKYFVDLEDANRYMISQSARKVHIKIMRYICNSEEDLFLGINQFLLEMTLKSPEDPNRMILSFLTKSDHLLISKRRKTPSESTMFQAWFDILEKNQLWIDNETEAISFLYFIMALVIQAWNDYIANDWSSEQLIEDLSFKMKWLREGLNQKKK